MKNINLIIMGCLCVPSAASAMSPCETAARAVELARQANLSVRPFERLREIECTAWPANAVNSQDPSRACRISE